MIYLFLADGFEECEALVPLDILRRANIEVKTVGVSGKIITGSHKIPVNCDLNQNEIDFKDLQGIILPGGMPGTINLENSNVVQTFIDYAFNNNLLIASICAAPSILGHKNILNDKKATCYNGFEKELFGAIICDSPVVVDQNIITAFGAGASFEFGFEILKYIKDEKTANDLKKQMRFTK